MKRVYEKYDSEKILLESILKNNESVDIEFCKWFMFLHTEDDDHKFVINMNKLVELKVYDLRGNAKKKLDSYFIQDTDYRVNKLACVFTQASLNSPLTPQKSTVIKTHGGHNKEEILLTIDCFKTMCMLPNNEMGKKVRRYYLFVERVLKEILNRSVKEMENKNNILMLEKDTLEKDKKDLEKDKIYLSSSLEKIKSQKNLLMKKKSYHKYEKGPVFYIVSDGDKELCSKDCTRKYRYKVGIDNKDINTRLRQYRTSIPHTKLEFLMYTEDNSLIEKGVLTKFKNRLLPYFNHEWIEAPLEEIKTAIDKIVELFEVEHKKSKVDSYNKIFYNENKINNKDNKFSKIPILNKNYTKIIFAD